MVLRICKYGEKVLREKAQPVVCVTDDLRRLADDMVETMHQAKGVGLAAEQVGRLERLCVIDIPGGCEDEADELFNAPIPMPLKLFNPEIIAQEGSQKDKEGFSSPRDFSSSSSKAGTHWGQSLNRSKGKRMNCLSMRRPRTGTIWTGSIGSYTLVWLYKYNENYSYLCKI